MNLQKYDKLFASNSTQTYLCVNSQLNFVKNTWLELKKLMVKKNEKRNV